MAQEIERKFLIKGDFRAAVFKSIRITQGYLSTVAERTVRIRIKGEQGYITIKGKGNTSGTSRFEWEKEIPLEEAKELLELCDTRTIDKTRFLVKSGDHTFEVDEFYGANKGLIVAEVELNDEHEEFLKPAWLGEEVTGDARYYNSMLVKKPYKDW